MNSVFVWQRRLCACMCIRQSVIVFIIFKISAHRRVRGVACVRNWVIATLFRASHTRASHTHTHKVRDTLAAVRFFQIFVLLGIQKHPEQTLLVVVRSVIDATNMWSCHRIKQRLISSQQCAIAFGSVCSFYQIRQLSASSAFVKVARHCNRHQCVHIISIDLHKRQTKHNTK